MKNTIYEMKNSLDEISSRLNTKFTEFEDTAVETIQIKIHGEKRSKKKMNRNAATCRKISSGLT